MTSEPPPLDRLASVRPGFVAPVESAEAIAYLASAARAVHHRHHPTVDGGTHS